LLREFQREYRLKAYRDIFFYLDAAHDGQTM
jgi:hypothetical protein